MYTLVVIDDNRIAVEAIAKAISMMELDCEIVGTAFNGVDGLSLIYSKHPDIVITDIRMPGYDGMQIISRAQQDGLKCRYIIVSGHGDFPYARRALQLGVSDFLLKPVSPEELRKVMSSTISSLSGEEPSAGNDGQWKQLCIIERMAPTFSRRVQYAVQWIHQHIHENITLSMLSEELGITPPYLSKIFKRETGVGFAHYVTLVKMRQAQQLLKNPQNKVYQVANMLGYNDYAYFFQVFKKHFGFMPSDKRFH